MNDELQFSRLNSQMKLQVLKTQMIDIACDRIFNRIVDEFCAIKGIEFISDSEYVNFEGKVRNLIQEELRRL